MATFSPGTCAHIVEVLRHRARTSPDRPAYTFLDRGERAVRTLSYGDLDRRARAIAAALRAHAGVQARALLLYPSGLEFIEAFWGCLYARLIAVPAYPPRANSHGLPRVQAIIADCAPEIVLSTRQHVQDAGEGLAVLGPRRTLSTDDLPDDAGERWETRDVDPDDVAMLQYSSGSTASPKGVVVLHRNIQANQVMIARAFQHSEISTFVGWLPFFHDMGLFGNIVQPLFIGAHSILMSPLSFLQKPSRWLQAISQYRAHTSGGPNFGYEYCVRRIAAEERTALDLRSWRTAFNGAEKPRVETMRRFAEAFAPCGFDSRAFYPCYGLAEAVLFSTGRDRTRVPEVTQASPSRDETAAATVVREVSSGCSWSPQRLAIVEPATGRRRAEGETGEIWIGGPHIAAGYWGQPALTQERFGATVQGEGDDRFLRTGDLGFLRDGELFVTGRLKDLIILRGQNHHPEDIEAVVEAAIPSLEPGQCAAFSLEEPDGSGERLTLLIEAPKTITAQTAEPFCATAAAAVSRAFGVAVSQIGLLRRGGIPKTSSGKIQRFLCRERMAANALDLIALVTFDSGGAADEDDARWDALRQELRTRRGPAREALLREQLHARLARALPSDGSGALAPDTSLVDNGLDSVRAVELKHWIARAIGVELAVAELFELPTIADLVSRIAARLAELDDMPAGANEPAPGAAALEAALDASDVSRVSDGQEALFFEYEKDPASAAYNISVAVELTGPFERPRAIEAIDRLLRRHPHLASTFVREGESVHQRERQIRAADLIELVDAGAWPRERLAQAVSAAANAPFDLARSALRVVLYEIDAPTEPTLDFPGSPVPQRDRSGERGSAVLLFVVHHLLCDLFSLELLLRDLARDYADERPAAPQSLPAVGDSATARGPLSYAAFTAWQRRFVDSPAGERSLAFWRERLDGVATTPRLACCAQTATVQATVGRVQAFQIGVEETAALKACAAREQATLSMVLFGAYAALLGQFLRESRVTIGTTVMGRPDEAFARTPGYFANVLPLPIEVDERRTFRALLGDVRQLMASALDHQHYPLSTLAGRLGARSNGTPNPVSSLRYAFTFGPARLDARILGLLQADPAVRLPFGALTATGFPIEREMAPFEITLMVLDRGDRLDAAFCHQTALVDAEAMASLRESYRAWLSVLARGADRPIGRLPIASPDPIAMSDVPDAPAAHDANRALDADASRFISVGERFTRQARQRPHAVALRHGAEQLSYGEANRRAESIARHLRGRGIGAESVVAVYCPRGVQMVLAILGIAKAGAVYLPLDVASLPPDRVRSVLRHAGAALVLTVASEAPACEGCGCDVLRLDADWSTIAQETALVQPARVERDQLAYIIYTSGSTGQPKGVELTQENVARLFDCAQPGFQFGPDDSWLLFHSIAFDVSVWEMWGALTHGGTLTVPDHASTRDPEAVLAHVLDDQVTVLCQTPSAFYNLLPCLARDARAARGLPVRAIVFAGEPLKYEQIASWFDRPDAARVQLVNMYGITETTVHTTRLDVERRHLAEAAGSAVGRCLDDFRLRLLTSSHQRLPDGALGEIALGGPGVARGYRGQPALTAARFVPDPFGGAPGGRMYLSGDLAYTRRGSELWHMGRMDRQVKIRGHRIEPAEIEAHVRTCPGVSWALVLVDARGDGTRALAAYVLADDAVTVAQLHEHLARLVPEYMIPAAFLRVPGLFTTPNGKVDVPRLRAEAEPLPRGRTYVAPRTEAEAVLARIWADVLRVPRVGIDDNYFELGGDSIRSIQVASRARQAGVPIDLPLLLAAQTIRRLCEPLATRTATAPIAWSAPFGLVSADDRARLPDDLEDALPVDTLLQGLMFHGQFSDDYQIYVTSFLVRAPWQPEALEAAIAAAVARHPFLRSSIDTTRYSEPLQLIHPTAVVPLLVEDLRTLSEEEQESHLRAWIDRETRRRFDWAQAPLLRVTVHRRHDDAFQITLGEPYLDGWCVASLFRELFETYLDRVSGADRPPLPPPRLTQRHFVQLERAAMQDEESRGFWRQFLRACPDSRVARVHHAQAPPERPHDRLVIALPPALESRLERLARRASVPLRTLFVAAHAHLLSVLTERRDIAFGVILNGRPEEEDGDRIIGSFLNAVPFRVSVDPRESWLAALERLFAIERAIWPHRRMPFAEIKKICGAALQYDTVFNFTYFHALEDLQARDDFAILDAYASEQTFFPLTAHVNRSILGGELELLLDYDCHALSAAQVAQIGEGFQLLLEEMAGAADRAGAVGAAAARLTSRLFAAPPAIAQAIDADVATTDAPPSVIESIDRQAALTPDRLAIVSEAGSITFGALKARTDALARWLCDNCGVGPEVRVGLHTRRSLSGLIGLLGILKAGGAYVTIDESCPAPRLAWQLADSGATALLVDDVLAERTEGVELPVWRLDQLLGTLATQRSATPRRAPDPDPEALAYILYTSGSTGRPKGVEVSHRALAQLAQAAIREYAIAPADRILQFATLEFDISVEEIFMTLCAGATLVLRPADLLESFDRFHDVCAREAITCLDLPTAFWHEWVQELDSCAESAERDASAGRQNNPTSLFSLSRQGEREEVGGWETSSSLRLVIIGGEAMRRDRAAQWLALAPSTLSLVNTYGPTEGIVTVTASWVVRGTARPSVPVPLPVAGTATNDGAEAGSPIGTSIGHPVVTILDRLGRPVAAAIRGELSIGGPGVARGYHARPGLTAERFTPDPDAALPGARRYGTGDIAYRGRDGALHYVGRLDHQVKVRGYRVELGEIEAALRDLPGVSQAIVCLEDAEGQASGLTAYVRFTTGAPSGADWETPMRDRLAAALPPYMVPARFRRVEQWPMSVTGKIDRHALARMASPARAVAPSTPAESTVAALASIWADCLRLDAVHPDDEFFALGGDSLTAMRVVSRVRAVLPCAMSVRDIFEAPRLGALADLLARRIASADSVPASAPEPQLEGPEDGEEVLSFAQERLWMAEQLSFEAPAYNLPAALVIRGSFRRAAFEQAMREIQRRHRVLQTRLVLESGRLQPVVDAAHTVDVQLVDVSAVTDQADDARLEPVRAELIRRPFDLARDVPLRIALLSAGDNHHQLAIALHHIVADGWSIELLVRELALLYGAFVKGEPSPLPPLPLQYADYARRERARLQGEHKARRIAFWETALAGVPDQVELPWDYERPAHNSFAGRRCYFTIPRGVADALEQLARAGGTTVFALLLTAYATLLHRRSGQTDIVIGTPVSNRDWPDTEKLIGLFVNQVAVRIDASGDPTWRQLLRRVRDTLVSAFEHSDLPFEELVTALRPRRAAGRLPLVQTIFTYWDRPWQAFTLDGLELTFPDLHAGTAKYELEVQVIDRGAAGLRGYFEYDASLFHEDTITAFAGEYARIVENIADRLDDSLLHSPARPAPLAGHASPSLEAR